MKKTLSLDITNPKSIEKTIKYLKWLEDELPKQCQKFCEKLAEYGVQIATVSASTSKLNAYVVFGKQMKKNDKTGCEMIVFGKDVAELMGEGIDAASVSPILMMEYGAGKFALPPQSIQDGHIEVGRGSFPGQTHAWDDNGWWYLSTKDGKWHHSYGMEPAYPMQYAYDSMVMKIDKIARECFRL